MAEKRQKPTVSHIPKSRLNPILASLLSVLALFILPFAVMASGSFGFNAQEKDDLLLTGKSEERKYVAGELIIKFKETSSIAKKDLPDPKNTGIKSIDKLNQRNKVIKQEIIIKKSSKEYKNRFSKKAIGRDKLENIYKLSIPKETDIETVAEEYNSDPNVEYAEPNFIVTTANTPNDPNYNSQWHLENISQNVNGITGISDADIDAPEGWNITTGNDQVVIAILDSGIDYLHEDLSSRMWFNQKEIPDNGVDDDMNGFTDDYRGYDFIGSNSNYLVKDNDPYDDNGHGTFVAGLAGAATNNGLGVSGVDWHATLMPVKVIDKAGYGTTISLVNGLTYAVDNGAWVINMSLGGPGSIPQIIANTLDYAESNGVISVAAAGNGGYDPVSWPASHDPVIAVGATDQKDKMAYFSNIGTKLDVTAPGVNMTSTDISGPGGYSDGNYASGGSGTSFSSPIAAGLISLIFATNSELTNKELRNRIFNYVDDTGTPGFDYYYGYGRINIEKSILAAPLAPDANGPKVIITNPLDGANIRGILYINAIVDDRSTGNSDISEIEYSIDGKELNPMNAMDGKFDSPFENATGQLSTALLSNGKHTITVISKDSSANWSKAAIVNINVVNGLPWSGLGVYVSRISLDSQAKEGNSHSGGWNGGPSISHDGRYVAFESYASNIVSGDTNYVGDIFRKDLMTGEVVRVSTRLQGNEANTYDRWASHNPSISADGRYVAFESFASNLVPGDTNGKEDIFRKDLQTGEVLRASTSSQGNQSDNETWYPTMHPSISADGRYVAFKSNSTNLVQSDTNGEPDIFRKDLETGETVRVSTDSQGKQANDDSWYASISADGRYVAFLSQASNLMPGDTNKRGDIFRKDLQSGKTISVSTDLYGNQANDDSWGNPSVSADGRYVTFQSHASNLVLGDTNDSVDIFRKDLQTGEITRASTDSQGNQAAGSSWFHSISPDGRYVVFASTATNLVSGTIRRLQEVYKKDMNTGEIVRVVMDLGGWQANNSSFFPSISFGGRYVSFVSYESNLVPGDLNVVGDVFVADMFYSDKTAPSITSFSVPRFSTNVSPTSGFNISWRGSDLGGSGIAGYNIRYRPHTTTAWSTLKIDGSSWTTKRSTAFKGRAGYTYYFRVRAKDRAGNISSWSPIKRTIVPYDDPALKYSGIWNQIYPLKSYKSTLNYSAKEGSYATFTFTGKSVALITQKGPYKGKVDVYIRDKKDSLWGVYYRVKTIDLYSSAYKIRVPIHIRSWTRKSTHSIKFIITGAKNTSSKGKRIDIDGVGILK